MATKRIFICFLFVIFCINTIYSQGVEEQRKYLLNDKTSLLLLIDSSSQLDGLSFYNHSQFTYFDIYLDTPEFYLYKNNLSLRFRKRIFEDSSITYGMQLKSEMESDTGTRMEVEETELDFYKVKTAKGWTPLTEIIDVLCRQLENNKIDPDSKEMKEAISLIQSWIKFKAEGTIVPFQKIAHLGLEVEKIKTLTPVIYGSDKRLRNSVYIDPKHTSEGLSNMAKNSADLSVVPDFFKNNPDFVWVLETSLDSAVFFPLFKSDFENVIIVEFEVENKYKPLVTGTRLMNLFETSLKKKLKIENLMDSKYRQSIKKFRNY